MDKTSPWALLLSGLFTASASAIITWHFFSWIPPVPVSVPVLLFVLAAVCLYLGWKVGSRISEGRIGLDRSQMSPMMVANCLVIAKASAWTGAITGGCYGGMVGYLVVHRNLLAAAAEDLPMVAAAFLAGVILAGAGLYLEHNCHVPPHNSEAAVG